MRRALLLGIAVMMAGCEASPLDQPWVSARPLAARTPSYVPPREPGADAGSLVEEPRGEVTLALAWQLALMHHPGLLADAWGVRAAEARAVQQGLSPNPTLEARLDDFGGRGDRRGFEKADVRLRVTQLIELGEKRAKRIALADAQRMLAAWDYEARRVAVAAQVTAYFVRVLAAQEEVALRKQAVDFAQAMHKIVEDRLGAGGLPPVERDRSAARVGQARIALGEAQVNLETARRLLAGTWDQSAATFTQAAGTLPATRPTAPALDDLIALLDDHPLIARWAGEISRRQADVELAKAKAVGDITLGGGVKYFREDDGQAFLFELGIPLPLFDDNRGEILEKRFALSKAHAQAKAARHEARSELIESYRDLARAHRKATLLREEVIPRLEAAAALTETNFKQGLAKLDDMLDESRSLLRAKVEHLAALADYHEAAAKLEGLMGRPLDGDAKP
jgi:cobalt-zinc-cadmium efflux system outer membrane protein